MSQFFGQGLRAKGMKEQSSIARHKPLHKQQSIAVVQGYQS
ncbi:hypothetical protein [Microcoleus sp. B7-D4]